MKHQVTRFKSLKIGLKEIEPFVRDGAHLQTGKPFKRFGGLRSREVLANWLLCAAANFACGADRLTFTSDPLGGDGIIYDNTTGRTSPTEHVLVPKASGSEAPDVEALILKAIGSKRDKGGAAYASGKTLVVFLNAGGGAWHPNKVARHLPKPLLFEAAWIVALQGVADGGYVYAVTRLDPDSGTAPAWYVCIGKDFDVWKVAPVQ